MIPKIIHYCWFGKGEIPQNLEQCINSWKKILPDYKIIRWDEGNFNINESIWTKEAYAKKKYAFVSDYVRLKVLIEYGGIYLDTDVKVIKKLDNLLKYDAFMGFENEYYLTSSIIGCIPNFPLIKEFFNYYKNKHFIDDNVIKNEANVIMMTNICKKYGLMINDKEQLIQNMKIFPRTYFCPYDFWMNRYFTENTYTIHYFNASWLDDDEKKRIEKERKIIFKLKSKIFFQLKKIIKVVMRR